MMTTLTVEDVCHLIAPAFNRGAWRSRDDLLWTAMNAWAPAPVVAALTRLPDQCFEGVEDVRQALETSLIP